MASSTSALAMAGFIVVDGVELDLHAEQRLGQTPWSVNKPSASIRAIASVPRLTCLRKRTRSAPENCWVLTSVPIAQSCPVRPGCGRDQRRALNLQGGHDLIGHRLLAARVGVHGRRS